MHSVFKSVCIGGLERNTENHNWHYVVTGGKLN